MIERSSLLSSRANARDLTNYSAIIVVREILRRLRGSG
jgi:hypothetical protein